MKYGGEGMIAMMMAILCRRIWKADYTPWRWREFVVGSLFRRRDKADPEYYRGLTLTNHRRRNVL